MEEKSAGGACGADVSQNCLRDRGLHREARSRSGRCHQGARAAKQHCAHAHAALSLMRLEGFMTWGRVKCCGTGASPAATSPIGWRCLHLPHQYSESRNSAGEFSLAGQLGRLAVFDHRAAIALRPKLQGSAWTSSHYSSLHNTCNYFVDGLSQNDIHRLRANLAMLDGLCIRTASTCSGFDSAIPVMKHALESHSSTAENALQE